MENFGKFMTVLLGLIISPLISGFVIMKLWFWFIVPIFGMQPLRIVEAIGLMLLVNYFTTKKKKSEEGKFWEGFAGSIFFLIAIASFALFSGWIVQMFM